MKDKASTTDGARRLRARAGMADPSRKTPASVTRRWASAVWDEFSDFALWDQWATPLDWMLSFGIGIYACFGWITGRRRDR